MQRHLVVSSFNNAKHNNYRIYCTLQCNEVYYFVAAKLKKKKPFKIIKLSQTNTLFLVFNLNKHNFPPLSQILPLEHQRWRKT